MDKVRKISFLGIVIFFGLLIASGQIKAEEGAVAYVEATDDLEKRFYESKKLTVDEIIGDMERVDDSTYQEKVYGSDNPVIVFFYNNESEGSKGVAMLDLELRKQYSSDISFLAYKLSDSDKTPMRVANKVESRYGTKDTPCLLIYDNDKGYVELEATKSGGIEKYKTLKDNIQVFSKNIPKLILD